MNQTTIPCGFRLFNMMPPCVLPQWHDGAHTDGFGGYYGNAGGFGITVPESRSNDRVAGINQETQ